MENPPTVIVNPFKTRKPYEKPSVRQLSWDQVRAILEQHAQKGERGAKEFLNLLFIALKAPVGKAS